MHSVLLQITYTVFAVFLVGYLLTARRKIDVFLVGGVSAVLFSLPLFFGSVSGPPGFPVRIIEPVVYVSFIYLLGTILVGAVLYDYSKVLNSASSNTLRKSSQENWIGCLLVMAWILIFFWLLQKYGAGLLVGESKRKIMDMVSWQFTVFMYISTLMAVWIFFFQGLIGKSFAVGVLIICLLIGQRTPLALSGIAILLLYGRKWQPVSLAFRYPLLTPLIIISGIGFVALIKPVYAHFKAGGITQVINLFSTSSISDLVARGSEFMRTQYIFNEIVLQDFSTNGGHIIRGPLSLLPFPRELYTTPSTEFNNLFQSELFPNHPSGMAYNSLAEFYAAAGSLGILVVVMAFVFSLMVLAIMMNRVRLTFMPVVAICSALIAFYSYRNSIAVTAGFIRFIVWPFLIIWLGTQLLMVLGRPISRGIEQS